MSPRRQKGEGGLSQVHDHASCPPAVKLVDPVTGRVSWDRPEHECRGRWRGRLLVEVDGRKRPKYVYGTTRKAAGIRLAHARRERDQGTLVIGRTTVGGWMRYWLTDVADVRPQTRAGYLSKIETLIVPHLGNYKLTALRPEHIRGWHKTLLEKGGRDGKPLSTSSVRQAHLILRKALQDAVYDQKLGTNPATPVKVPSMGKSQRPALDVAAAANVLRAAGQNPRWWLAVLYGWRQGEALGLRWCDIDTDEGTIRIEQTSQMGGRVFGPPKTTESARTMPLLPRLAAMFELMRPAGVDPEQLVFVDEHGDTVKPWRDNREWHALLAEAGAPDMPLHSARHSAASLLEAAGVPDRMAAEILGHSQVATTHKYTHAEDARKRAALEDALEVLAIEA